MSANLNIIIMAGGLGKRMESSVPKVLHKILNKPMIVHVIEESIKLHPLKIIIVVGKYRDIIEKTITEYVDINQINLKFVNQPTAIGTGNAIYCCIDELTHNIHNINTTTLILSGDVPLLKTDTMLAVITHINKVKLITAEMINSTGYGRIIELNNKFVKIVEENDCTHEEKEIKKINCGIYAFKTDILCKYLPYISNNNSQKEYYLTDIIEIIKNNEDVEVDMFNIPQYKIHEIIGVNTKAQLADLENSMI